MSGAMFLGVPGQAYTKGWPIVFGICMTSGMVGVLLANLLLAKPMRRYSEHHSCTTITEILVDIFEDKRLRYILIPTILLGNLFYGMAQWVSIGNLSGPVFKRGFYPDESEHGGSGYRECVCS